MSEGYTRLTAGEIIKEGNLAFDNLRLPWMKHPDSLNEEYDFPTNVTQLSSHSLGSLQLKLSQYLTWTLDILGKDDAELGALTEKFTLLVGLKAHEEQQLAGKLVKEIAMARAIDGDERLSAAFDSIAKRKVRITRLKARVAAWQEQVNRLSREQSRREMDMRGGG